MKKDTKHEFLVALKMPSNAAKGADTHVRFSFYKSCSQQLGCTVCLACRSGIFLTTKLLGKGYISFDVEPMARKNARRLAAICEQAKAEICQQQGRFWDCLQNSLAAAGRELPETITVD